MAPRQWVNRQSPVSKDTAGIGPAIDRRRARRAGTDALPACACAPPASDVPRPLKNPRRLALQVSITGAIPLRRWRISTRDRPPSSTFRHRGRSSVLCCLLSRRACSLSSAGNVCWAKPNHGFFHCQQPVANFFHRNARANAQRHPRARPHRIDANHAGCGCVDAAMRCMQALARPAAFRCDARARMREACADASHRPRKRASRTRSCARAVVDARAFSRRTSRFARKLRELLAPARSVRRARARIRCRGNEEARAVSGAGPGRPRRCARRVSGLRPPAVRRSRPAQADR